MATYHVSTSMILNASSYNSKHNASEEMPSVSTRIRMVWYSCRGIRCKPSDATISETACTLFRKCKSRAQHLQRRLDIERKRAKRLD